MRSNQSNLFRAFSFAVAVLCLSGCASLFNPYDSEFSCNASPNGRCVTPQQAYDESRGKIAVKETTSDDCPDCVDVKKDAPKNKQKSELPAKPGGELTYREASMSKMASLLKNPTTPMVVPPTIMRVLIMPYQNDDEELLMPRFVYVMVDKPKWIVGDYLAKEIKDGDY